MNDKDAEPGFEREQWLSTDEAAKLLGVGVSSIKRWVDQGVLRATKTPGGHRRLAKADVEKLLPATAPANPSTPTPPSSIEEWTELCLSTTPQGELLARAHTKQKELGSWWAFCELLGQVLVEVGRRWILGKLSIVDEHAVSDRIERVLHAVAAGLDCDAQAPTALLMTAPNDDHTLGLLLVEVTLREAGFNTRWSGRNTPAEQVRALVESGAVSCVAISASAASTDRETLRDFAQALADTCHESGAMLLLGGAGAWPDHPNGAIRIHHLKDLAEMSQQWVRKLTATSPHEA